MAPATADPLRTDHTTLRDRTVDAVRQAAHVAREAQLLKELASDAAEDGVHAAKRAITHSIRNLEDLRESAVHRIKRAPLMAIGLSFGAGILLGIVFGRIARTAATRNR